MEAYTLLASFWAWRKLLAEANGGLAIVGDAWRVVYDALKLRSADSQLNAIMDERAELCQSLTTYGPNVPKQLVRKNCGFSFMDGYTDATNVGIHCYALGRPGINTHIHDAHAQLLLPRH